MTSVQLLHVLTAVAALLVAAHLGALTAKRLGLPSMVGELSGGVVLGATVLARVWPAGHAWLLPRSSPVAPILEFCSTVGLLLLMFLGGLQLRRLVTRTDVRAVGWISALGVLIPVGAGLALLEVIDVSPLLGRAGHLGALKLVLLIEAAITSIPVITRIFLDLGLMKTRLARIALTVAVIEDVLLYIALSIALGLAQAEGPVDASLPRHLGLTPRSPWFLGWHVVVSLTFLAVASIRVRRTRDGTQHLNALARHSPFGWMTAAIFATTAIAMLLGLAPMFGALVAGVMASHDTDPALLKAQRRVEAIATSFFVPLYFALIGASLDLIHDFDWRFTAGILVVGSVLKYGGALLGARLAGETPTMASAVAISVNARGGPGLVVASTAFAAGIISSVAYTSLVVLAIATSLLASVVLANVLRRSGASVELGAGQSPASP